MYFDVYELFYRVFRLGFLVILTFSNQILEFLKNEGRSYYCKGSFVSDGTKNIDVLADT